MRTPLAAMAGSHAYLGTSDGMTAVTSA